MSLIKQNRGLTLIEVLFAIFFLAILSLTTFYSVRSTFSIQRAINQSTERFQESRAFSALIKRDLMGAFIQTPEDLGWSPLPLKDDNGNALPLPSPPATLTFFRGDSKSLFFASNTHQRLFQNAAENEQHLVTYAMDDKQLNRGESLRLISSDTRESTDDFRKTVLIENVEKLEFSFWDEKQDKWVDTWDSEKAEHIDRLPPIVKIDLTFRPDIEIVAGQKEPPSQRIVTAITLTQSIFRPALANQKTETPQTPGVPDPNEGTPQ